MKTIENLEITSTFTVKLANVEVPDDIYEELMSTCYFNSFDTESEDVIEWLCDNIKEEDAFMQGYEIDTIE